MDRAVAPPDQPFSPTTVTAKKDCLNKTRLTHLPGWVFCRYRDVSQAVVTGLLAVAVPGQLIGFAAV